MSIISVFISKTIQSLVESLPESFLFSSWMHLHSGNKLNDLSRYEKYNLDMFLGESTFIEKRSVNPMEMKT